MIFEFTSFRKSFISGALKVHPAGFEPATFGFVKWMYRDDKRNTMTCADIFNEAVCRKILYS